MHEAGRRKLWPLVTAFFPAQIGVVRSDVVLRGRSAQRTTHHGIISLHVACGCESDRAGDRVRNDVRASRLGAGRHFVGRSFQVEMTQAAGSMGTNLGTFDPDFSYRRDDRLAQ